MTTTVRRANSSWRRKHHLVTQTVKMGPAVPTDGTYLGSKLSANPTQVSLVERPAVC